MINEPVQRHPFRLSTTLIVVLSTSISAIANTEVTEDAPVAASVHEPFSGVVRAGQRAVLSAELDSVVLSMPFHEGERFKQDDVLIALDCTLAQAAFGQSSARRDLAIQDHESNQQLKALNSVSELELAESKTRLAETSYEMQAALYRYDRCQVLAPFDGVVLRHDVRKHERVQTGQQLLEVASSDGYTVEFLVPSSQASHLQADQTFSFVIGETGHARPGRITRIVPDVDPVSRTVKMIGELDVLNRPELAAASPALKNTGSTDTGSTSTDSPLWPGMSGWVQINE